MSKRSGATKRSRKRNPRRKPSRAVSILREEPLRDLASRLRGIYRRVARRLQVDPSFVSRVARAERHSRAVERALRRELLAVIRAASARKPHRKK